LTFTFLGVFLTEKAKRGEKHGRYRQFYQGHRVPGVRSSVPVVSPGQSSDGDTEGGEEVEWEKVLRELKELAWSIIEIVIRLLIQKKTEYKDFSKVQAAIAQLNKVSHEMDRLVQENKIPFEGKERNV
jgi:hypothetical protein